MRREREGEGVPAESLPISVGKTAKNRPKTTFTNMAERMKKKWFATSPNPLPTSLVLPVCVGILGTPPRQSLEGCHVSTLPNTPFSLCVAPLKGAHFFCY